MFIVHLWLAILLQLPKQLLEYFYFFFFFLEPNSETFQQIRLEIPLINASFVGSGDLFAALLLAWTHIHPDNLQLALEKVISTMQHVLKRTLSSAQGM